MSGRFWIWKFSESQIYSKVAVECDWNNKISETRTKVGFSWKKLGFFFEKNWSFSKSVEVENLPSNQYKMTLFL